MAKMSLECHGGSVGAAALKTGIVLSEVPYVRLEAVNEHLGLNAACGFSVLAALK